MKKGSIYFLLGLLIVLGAAGGMEDPENNLFLCLVVAAAGLTMMSKGTYHIRNDH